MALIHKCIKSRESLMVKSMLLRKSDWITYQKRKKTTPSTKWGSSPPSDTWMSFLIRKLSLNLPLSLSGKLLHKLTQPKHSNGVRWQRWLVSEDLGTSVTQLDLCWTRCVEDFHLSRSRPQGSSWLKRDAQGLEVSQRLFKQRLHSEARWYECVQSGQRQGAQLHSDWNSLLCEPRSVEGRTLWHQEWHMVFRLCSLRNDCFEAPFLS